MERKLGFGCMHLPLTEAGNPASIDHDAFARMTDIFLERGFVYFDTASTYHDGHGEAALRRALVERYPREAYTLADKLPTMLIESAEEQERIFARQLSACGVEYFDRYLVHCATRAFWERAERFGSFDFVLNKRREGRVRLAGFSYHDSPELLDEILTRYPELDFVQLQISYVDWEHTPIQAHRCYDVARRHGKPVVAMCPLKGGMLARVPAATERMMRDCRPDLNPSLWALRYVASLDRVETVLSGMSSVAQIEENTACMARFSPLDARERAIVVRAADDVCRAAPIQCTACGYCVPVCPQSIPIPEALRLFNDDTGDGHTLLGQHRAEYESVARGRGRASECLGCHSCESSCPQHIRIVDWLRQVASVFETQQKPRMCSKY